MEENIAKIHSMESFSTVDGPGIRFVLFMQGCPLRCKYCHNRDTWNYHSGTSHTLNEILERILRSRPYIKNGGVTVSGGEPLLQAKFLTNLFKKLKELNIHTALDTSGSLPISDETKELLHYTDLVLLDIKHIDNEKCINLTGTPNTNTLNFAQYLSENGNHMWIRQVLLPGYTDDESDLYQLKNFIHDLNYVDKVELLPYHNLGKYKWEELGFQYELENVNPPSEEEIVKAKNILKI